MTNSVYSKDNIKINYEVAGKGDPVLVFVHCWCGDRSYWKSQYEHFNKKYTCINLDLAGHGESGNGRTSWTMKAFGEDVFAVLNQVNPAKVILIGHSLGGVAVLTLISSLKEKLAGIIGVDSFSYLEFELSEDELEMFVQPYKTNFSRTVREFTSVLFAQGVSQELKNKIIEHIASADSEIAVEAFKEFLRFKVTAEIKEFNRPVICINSDRHPTKVDMLKRHFKNLDVKIMSNSGHFLMMEDPERFNKLLDESINQILHST